MSKSLAPHKHAIPTALKAIAARFPEVRFARAEAARETTFDGGELDMVQRAETLAGRKAAGIALQQLGLVPAEIPADPDGVPLFPRGVVGSISHKHGQAVAAVARIGPLGLGVDLERDHASDELALRDEVLTTRERARSALLEQSAGVASIATLVLSAKEAAYKAIFPITRVWFTFDEIELDYDCGSKSFWVCRCAHAGGRAIRGAWECVEGWLVCVAVVSEQAGGRAV